MGDSMHLELFTGRQYLEEISISGIYGDETILRATAHMFNVKITVTSSLGEGGTAIIIPEDSIPYHTLVLASTSSRDTGKNISGCDEIILFLIP